MAGWGVWALTTSLEAGLLGLLLWATAALLRPRPAWEAALLALGMARFLVPPLLPVTLWDATLIVKFGSGAATAATDEAMAGIALAQWAGLLVGALILLCSAVRLRRGLARAERVDEGPLIDALRGVAERLGTRTPRLYLTDMSAPAAAGVLRGAVLLPRGLARRLDPAALRMVLAHEVAHVARRDPLVAALRTSMVSLWWFHPIAWALARRHRRAVEDACDDAALAQGFGRADAYCQTLLACAAPGPPSLSFTAGLGGHPLGRRFRRLLAPRPAPRMGGRAFAVLAAAALLALPVQFLTFDTRPGSRPDARIVIRQEVVIRSVRD